MASFVPPGIGAWSPWRRRGREDTNVHRGIAAAPCQPSPGKKKKKKTSLAVMVFYRKAILKFLMNDTNTHVFVL
jgi:hypothetical protein